MAGVYKFTEPIQLKILAALWLNNESYTLYQDVIQPRYFSNEMYIDICRIIFDYRNKYKSAPTLESLVEEVVSFCENSRKKQKVLDEYLAVLERMAKVDTADIEYIEDKIIGFGKRQALVDAIYESANILDKSPETKYGDIEKLVKEALLVGENTTDLGVDIFENIEERFLSYVTEEDVIERISTGIEKLDAVLGGGLGRTELGVIVAAPGRGKALAPTTPVLTPKGYKPIKDIHVGDKVISAQGNYTTVTGVYPHQSKKLYKVRFVGTNFVWCCDEHLWFARKCDDFEYKVWEFKDMIPFLERGLYFEVPRLTQPVKYVNDDPSEFLPIDPYVLGAYFSGTLVDKAYIEMVDLKNPRIPKEYLYASISSRKRFLQGLLSNFKSSVGNIRSYSSPLIDDIKFLAETTGMYCSPVYQKDGKYSVFIDQNFPAYYAMVSCEYIGKTNAVCIAVDDPSHCYVIKDGIITHNTTTLISMGAAAVENGYNVLHLSLENNEKQIARNYDVRLLKKNREYIENNIDRAIVAMKNIKAYKKGSLRIKKYPTKSITVQTVRALLDKYKSIQNFVPDVIILDYGALLKSSNPTLDKRNAIESIFEEIRALADDYNVAIWSAAQGNRGALSKKIVSMGDLAECFAISNIVDVMACLCQTMKEKVKGDLRMFLPKIRDNADTMILSGKIHYDIKKIELNEVVANVEESTEEESWEE